MLSKIVMDKYASRPAGLSLGQPYFMGCLVPAERVALCLRKRKMNLGEVNLSLVIQLQCMGPGVQARPAALDGWKVYFISL